jgi:ABC-type uncharacterized transport system substrate-binding protein
MKRIALVSMCTFLAMGSSAFAKTCLFINSYHTGYEWSDGIEKGLEQGLGGKCELTKFYMDSKRNKDGAEAKGKEAKALIDAKKPDVVIIADDNAVKFILQPFYKDAKVPFIFTGVNWTGEGYGLPYKNTTGMLEVAPVQAIVQEVRAANKAVKTAVFLSADNESEQKDLNYTTKLFAAAGIKMTGVLVKNFADWKKAYKEAQESADLVFLNNNAGVADWNDGEAKEFATQNMKKLTTGIYEWMLPYASFVMMKSPEEQGKFAAKAAIAIMGGKAPNSISVEKNFEYSPAVNVGLSQKLPYKLSEALMKKSKKI